MSTCIRFSRKLLHGLKTRCCFVKIYGVPAEKSDRNQHLLLGLWMTEWHYYHHYYYYCYYCHSNTSNPECSSTITKESYNVNIQTGYLLNQKHWTVQKWEACLLMCAWKQLWNHDHPPTKSSLADEEGCWRLHLLPECMLQARKIHKCFGFLSFCELIIFEASFQAEVDILLSTKQLIMSFCAVITSFFLWN